MGSSCSSNDQKDAKPTTKKQLQNDTKKQLQNDIDRVKQQKEAEEADRAKQQKEAEEADRAKQQKEAEEAEKQREDTPLHRAARDGDTDRVYALLQNGADVDACDVAGKTPLHHAAEHGHTVTVNVLLQNGADANAYDTGGHTPLGCIALKEWSPSLEANRRDAETVRALLSGGADANACAVGATTALRQSIAASVLLPCGNAEMIEALQGAGGVSAIRTSLVALQLDSGEELIESMPEQQMIQALRESFRATRESFRVSEVDLDNKASALSPANTEPVDRMLAKDITRISADGSPDLYVDKEMLMSDTDALRLQAIEDTAAAVALTNGFKKKERKRINSKSQGDSEEHYVVVTQRPKYMKSKITAFCSVGIVAGLTPMEGFQFMSSDKLEDRLQWDDNCASATMLEGPKQVPGEWGDYWCFHNSQHPYLGGLVGARDFLTLNVKWVDETGAVWMASRSIPKHPRYSATNKKLIRSTLHICVFKFEPWEAAESGQPQTKITYLSCMDLKMSSFLKSPIESGMVDEQKRLFKVFREKAKKSMMGDDL